MDFKGLGLDDKVRKAAFITSLENSFTAVFESHERLNDFLANDIDDDGVRDTLRGLINGVIDPFVTFDGTTAAYKFRTENGNVEIQIDNTADFTLDSFLQRKPTTFAQPVEELQVPNDIRDVSIRKKLRVLISRLSRIRDQFGSSVYNKYVLEPAAAAAAAAAASAASN